MGLDAASSLFIWSRSPSRLLRLGLLCRTNKQGFNQLLGASPFFPLCFGEIAAEPFDAGEFAGAQLFLGENSVRGD